VVLLHAVLIGFNAAAAMLLKWHRYSRVGRRSERRQLATVIGCVLEPRQGLDALASHRVANGLRANPLWDQRWSRRSRRCRAASRSWLILNQLIRMRA
jgi:hypothetical protein